MLAAGVVLLTSLPAARASAAEPASPLPAPYLVAIDAGHGGSVTSDPNGLWDPGVVVGVVMEKDITLDLALRLRKLLEQERVQVVMTRTADRYMSIADRWAVVQGSGARMFISMHVNAFDGDPAINGTTVFYPKPESILFAQSIESGLAHSLKAFGIVDDGVAIKPELWVRSTIPTATVEPAYLTNAREAQLLERDNFRAAIAAGVYRGMLAADPAIEATRIQIVRAEALQASQRETAARVSKAGDRGAESVRWGLIIGGTLILWVVARGARRSLRAQPVRRRNVRRRRTGLRRF